jgi:hypothetical protein
MYHLTTTPAYRPKLNVTGAKEGFTGRPLSGRSGELALPMPGPRAGNDIDRVSDEPSDRGGFILNGSHGRGAVGWTGGNAWVVLLASELVHPGVPRWTRIEQPSLSVN